MTRPDDADPLVRRARELARELAPQALADAIARAQEQASTRLTELLSEAIVAEALAQHRAPSPRPAAPPAPAGPVVLYAYGITAADLPVPGAADGVPAGEGVELVPDGDLGLLVSRVDPAALRVDPDDLSETGRLATLARRHDAVVRAAVAGGAVLPLRFGTAVPDEEAARRLLREHAETARAQLRRLGDGREWGVRLVRSLGPAEDVPAPAAARAELTGTDYLTRRREALRRREDAAREAAEGADRLQESLAPHAAETLRRGGAAGSSLLLDVAYLVRPDAEATFLAEAERLAAELKRDGLELELSGPWPPYSFASLDPGGGDGS
jgi:hypothetical protein